MLLKPPASETHCAARAEILASKSFSVRLTLLTNQSISAEQSGAGRERWVEQGALILSLALVLKLHIVALTTNKKNESIFSCILEAHEL